MKGQERRWWWRVWPGQVLILLAVLLTPFLRWTPWEVLRAHLVGLVVATLVHWLIEGGER
jgi:MFS superfamily sulfate permease-like transporter